MSVLAGAIDCDVHPVLPGLRSLFPYLNDAWCEQLTLRGMHELVSNNYPPNAPLSVRPDWLPETGPPAQLPHLQNHILNHLGIRMAICNCLYGVQLLFSEDMAAAIAGALNEWMARELLDREPRLRASIVVPMQNTDLAVDEIERRAPDHRFVQILVLAMGDMPLGRRAYWPIYAAAERHRLPIGIHAGGNYHNPTTPTGWGTYHSEDYINQGQAFQTQLASLICEGVFQKFPKLSVVLIESGFTWLPAFLWRAAKFWRGLRPEVPWVDRSPEEIVREHVRLTLQPIDAPPTEGQLERFWEHMASDELLLFSTDYPHWQFDGDSPLPPNLPNSLARRIMVDNPIATYPRLRETLA